ncbi:hypothetical protein IMSAGC009_03389 [Lachnospiraceae bacterium]|nr:hypothetical protein IMSAGC009_03389 [Lachnospiraceae bacterium]
MIPGLTCFLPRINTAMFQKIVLAIITGSSVKKQESAIHTAPGMDVVPVCIASAILLLSGHLIKMGVAG